ncbi:MAG TPA: hypothetical protein VHD89_03890, partial [Rhodanobacteraceae bacterium]|nr:hypothetical protein [Rhodanobacteraceae bacterium]
MTRCDYRSAVIPAKAGIHLAFAQSKMDSGFRRNDDQKQKHFATRLAGALLVVLLVFLMSPAIAASPTRVR